MFHKGVYLLELLSCKSKKPWRKWHVAIKIADIIFDGLLRQALLGDYDFSFGLAVDWSQHCAEGQWCFGVKIVLAS